MRQKLPDVYIALPAMNELENLPRFMADFDAQDYAGNIFLFVCVNQPEAWWNDPEKMAICLNNAGSLVFFANHPNKRVTVIDRSSKGRGWIGRQHGVGFARREVMQAIANVAKDTDIMISLDADTGFRKNYFSTVVDTLCANPKAVALSVPYYHNLAGNEAADRAILRYEIYMRCYAINLIRIGSPYAFTALGSAIALTVKIYKSIGGITPKLSGEDFYFLQKLRKKGKVLTRNTEKVYPAARFSNRVYFGTGPAIIKGAAGNWSGYPVYHHTWFDDVRKLYDLFPALFRGDVETPLDEFLKEIFLGENFWDKLRKNTSSKEKFVWACHQKIDGLRILQYLKWQHRQSPVNDEQSLKDLIERFYPEAGILHFFKNPKTFSFASASIADLNQLRDFLVEKESGEIFKI
jgi:hypothetical protein